MPEGNRRALTCVEKPRVLKDPELSENHHSRSAQHRPLEGTCRRVCVLAYYGFSRHPDWGLEGGVLGGQTVAEGATWGVRQ